MTTARLATWKCIAEASALRRDAPTFGTIVLAVPRIGRASLPSSTLKAAHQEYEFMARFFDTVNHFSMPDPGPDYVEHLRYKVVHRTGGPALEFTSRIQIWKRYGILHRTDGPAFVDHKNRNKNWVVQGEYHRNDGPAVHAEYGLNGFWIKEWLVGGKRHRSDGPAVEHSDGDKEWWVEHKRHRVDGPAVEKSNGDKEWWVNGQRHRVDGPAVEKPDGANEWWVNGQRHRADGPAIESERGNEWWLNGERHRTDGPAIDNRSVYGGSCCRHREWWVHGQLHRSDGPAVELRDEKVWYVHGIRVQNDNVRSDSPLAVASYPKHSH